MTIPERYVIDAQRDAITYAQENRLLEFVEWAAKSLEKIAPNVRRPRAMEGHDPSGAETAQGRRVDRLQLRYKVGKITEAGRRAAERTVTEPDK